MFGPLRGMTRYDGRSMVEGLAAIEYARALGHQRPTLLAYHPVARVNPYELLLYQRAWQHGIAPLALQDIEDLDVLPLLMEHDADVVFHLHWTLEVLKSATTQQEAERRLADFLDRLDRFAKAGGRLVWTVHNVLPHDCAFPELETALSQEIVDRCDIVHILGRSTVEDVAPWFALPASRLLHVPHPNYIGAYPRVITREQARYDLGVEPDQIAYLAFGAIKAYKGLPDLLDAFDAISATDPGSRLLFVAGLPDGNSDGVLQRCLRHPHVRVRAERVPDVDVQRYFQAADVVVLPYSRTLNSGVLMLALSFGVPVVAPEAGSIRELVDERYAALFALDGSGGLEAALRTADSLLTPAARQAARAAAEARAPGPLSDQFCEAIITKLR